MYFIFHCIEKDFCFCPLNRATITLAVTALTQLRAALPFNIDAVSMPISVMCVFLATAVILLAVAKVCNPAHGGGSGGMTSGHPSNHTTVLVPIVVVLFAMQ